ncbi:MAG: hypothetical protein JRH16_08895 [Deltaproteobacteria bacterium]|nr:hypothetical protein [Deltaproteobacteria bacterium]MBW2359613.1 hypothetical protein [Deltaproteobacteria bacterium]
MLARTLERLRSGESRPIRGARVLRTVLRAAHLLAFGAFYGGSVYGVAPERLAPAFAAVVVSGAAFALFEICRAPIWLVEVRGVATIGKLALLALIPLFGECRISILTGVAVIGAVVSHMSGGYRHYSLLHRRVVSKNVRG